MIDYVNDYALTFSQDFLKHKVFPANELLCGRRVYCARGCVECLIDHPWRFHLEDGSILYSYFRNPPKQMRYNWGPRQITDASQVMTRYDITAVVG